MKKDIQNEMELVRNLHVFVIINNFGIKINPDMNVKNQLTKPDMIYLECQ